MEALASGPGLPGRLSMVSPTKHLLSRGFWPTDRDRNNPRDCLSLEQVARGVAQKGRRDLEKMHRAALRVGWGGVG